MLLGDTDKLPQIGYRHRCISARDLAVHPVPILGIGRPRLIQQSTTALRRIAVLAQQIAVGCIGRFQTTNPVDHRLRHWNLGDQRSLQQAVDERQVFPKMECRHHRHADAHQGIVGVIPLWALGVEPDPSIGSQVGEFGQCGHQQLFSQRGMVDLTVLTGNQLPVQADGHDPLVDSRLFGVVELEGVLGIADYSLIGQDPVRNIGIGESPVMQHPLQNAGVVPMHRIKETMEVDDLMVSPIAEVGPTSLFGHLPLDSLTSDPVGIVPVLRGGIEKLGDH